MKVVEKIQNVMLGYIVCFIWITLIDKLLEWFRGFEIPNTPPGINLTAFVASCVVAPLWEELVFRHAPLQLSKLVPTKSDSDQMRLLFGISIISSFYFGIQHEGSYHPVLIQGFLGLVMCWVYIRNGYSYWSSVLLHGLWNLTCHVYNF